MNFDLVLAFSTLAIICSPMLIDAWTSRHPH